MRQLTDVELQEIRKAIMRKEISSAEILMEVWKIKSKTALA
ncbi:hypothetical protein [Cecembia lonarensis]|nr:hypothetical protein [Cecembia lonarensis]